MIAVVLVPLALLIWVLIEGPERCLNLLNGSWKEAPDRTRAARPLKTLLIVSFIAAILIFMELNAR